jgi:hypothetical protein
MGLPNARLRGVVVEIDLAPPVSLDPASQREFQRKVEDRCVELNYIRRAAEGIEFGRRHPNSPELMRIIARPEKLSIEESFRPELSLVVKEIDEIVKAARDTLNPRLFLEQQVAQFLQVSDPEAGGSNG